MRDAKPVARYSLSHEDGDKQLQAIVNNAGSEMIHENASNLFHLTSDANAWDIMRLYCDTHPTCQEEYLISFCTFM